MTAARGDPRPAVLRSRAPWRGSCFRRALLATLFEIEVIWSAEPTQFG